MATDEEKSKIKKLLQNVEVPEVKLTERCSSLVNEFHKRFQKEVEDEIQQEESPIEVYENPYRVDPGLLEENERKLRELLAKNKRVKKQDSQSNLDVQDPKRPWRTHSNKEKLLRIDNDLKRHVESSSQLIVPLADDAMQDLVKECQEESRAAPPVALCRLRDTVEAARKNLCNFQYRNIANSTAMSIMSDAHDCEAKKNLIPTKPE